MAKLIQETLEFNIYEMTLVRFIILFCQVPAPGQPLNIVSGFHSPVNGFHQISTDAEGGEFAVVASRVDPVGQKYKDEL